MVVTIRLEVEGWKGGTRVGMGVGVGVGVDRWTRCATGGTKKTVSVDLRLALAAGVEALRAWSVERGAAPSGPHREMDPTWGCRRVFPVRPVAQGPVSSGPTRSMLHLREGSVGPVRPLLPGVAVVPFLRSNSAVRLFPLFLFCLHSLPHPHTHKRNGQPLSALSSGRGAGTGGNGEGDGSAWTSDG